MFEGERQLSDQSVHLSFDRAAYTEHSGGPCQILARSFYSPGLGYCVQVDQTGYAVPVPKNAIKTAMENGVFVWVPHIKPVQLMSGSVINLMVKFSTLISDYAPLVCNEQELQEIVCSQPYYSSLRKSGTKTYRFNPRIGHGSNLRNHRSEAL